MQLDVLTIAQLSMVISQITAPAFLLAAEAEFLAVLVSRMDRIVDRSRTISTISADESARAHLKAELPILRRRAVLMHRAIFWTVASGVVTSLLVILGFVTAFLHARHEYGAAIMFIIALGLFTAALISFGLEVRLAISEVDRFG